MNNEKKVYLPPEITVIQLDAGDMLTTSGGSDAYDNWASDFFD